MAGTLRALIKLVLVVLVVHAAVRVVPPFWNYVKFRDACEEIARFSAKRTVEDVTARVLTKAGQLDIPIAQEQVQVRKQGTITFIDAGYTAQLEYLPTKFYVYQFKVNVHGTPPTYETLP
jgi:hypothetical protein